MSQSKKILIVDDETIIRDLMGRYFRRKNYDVSVAANAHDALMLFQKEKFDIVVTDVKMPDYDGKWLLKQMLSEDPNMAVLMITGVDDTKEAVDCLRLGAYDYIIKPFDTEEIRIAVERALERKSLLMQKRKYQEKLESKVRERTLELLRAYEEIESTYQKTLEALITALDVREKSTGGHSKRVVEYTRVLATKLRVRGTLLLGITRGALLHDVGKIGIPDSILLKPGSLSDEEWSIMRQHTLIGYHMLKGIKFLKPALDVVRYHHERWDGKGYPEGLAGEEIPLGARIFAVADTFDAITSSRVYQEARSLEKAREIIQAEAGKQFDPRIVDAFQSIPVRVLERIMRSGERSDISNIVQQVRQILKQMETSEN
ncbi:MAG: response regulator [Calditrichaeota bacterium]|nr:response regulator [Calditrichota bacterium]